MTPIALTQYLHDHIPLSAAMAAGVTALSPESVTVTAPIETTFTATAQLEKPAAYPRFHKTLLRHSKARIAVTATLAYRDLICANFTRTFVALQ